MSLFPVQRPSIQNITQLNVHSAVANPVLYKFTRRDIIWSSLVSNAGKIQITIAGNVTANFTAGDTFWLNSGSGPYAQIVTVVSAAFTTTTQVTFAEAWTVNDALGGWINWASGTNALSARINYFVTLELWDAVTNQLLFSAIKATPDKTGNMIIDVGPTLSAFVSPDNTYDYTAPSQVAIDAGVTRSFYAQYTEFWTGSANAKTNDSANSFIVVCAARQIGSAPFGSNMADYVSYFQLYNGTTQSKWLTPFLRPKIYTGYAFTISMLVGQEWIANTMSFKLVFTDNAGNITTINTANQVPGVGQCYRINPDQIYFASQGVHMPTTMVTVTIQLFCTTSAPVAVSQIITCDIIDSTRLKNIVNLWWRNSLGGDSWGVFHYSQDETYKFQNITKNKRLTLIANELTQNEWDCIQECETMGDVVQPALVELLSTTNLTLQKIGQQVYLIDVNGNKTGGIVIPTEQTTKTISTKNILKITVDLPIVFTQ